MLFQRSWDRFVDLVVKQAKKRPYFDLNNYMRRYWLVTPITIGKFHFSIRVHEILGSDDDVLHDHPRSSMSLILRNSYLEIMPIDQGQPAVADKVRLLSKLRKPGQIILRKATDRHKLQLLGAPVTTVFVMWGRHQDWGFYAEEGKVLWKRYLGIPDNKTEQEATPQRTRRLERIR